MHVGISLEPPVTVFFQVEEYVKAHYPNGTTSVYSTSPKEIVICIEDHEFQAGNYWGGRWERCLTFITAKNNPKNISPTKTVFFKRA